MALSLAGSHVYALYTAIAGYNGVQLSMVFIARFRIARCCTSLQKFPNPDDKRFLFDR